MAEDMTLGPIFTSGNFSNTLWASTDATTIEGMLSADNIGRHIDIETITGTENIIEKLEELVGGEEGNGLFYNSETHQKISEKLKEFDGSALYVRGNKVLGEDQTEVEFRTNENHYLHLQEKGAEVTVELPTDEVKIEERVKYNMVDTNPEEIFTFLDKSKWLRKTKSGPREKDVICEYHKNTGRLLKQRTSVKRIPVEYRAKPNKKRELNDFHRYYAVSDQSDNSSVPINNYILIRDYNEMTREFGYFAFDRSRGTVEYNTIHTKEKMPELDNPDNVVLVLPEYKASAKHYIKQFGDINKVSVHRRFR